MHVTKTLSLTHKNIEWMQNQNMNMSDFVDRLISAARLKINPPLSPEQEQFEENKRKSEAAYKEWDDKRVIIHGA